VEQLPPPLPQRTPRGKKTAEITVKTEEEVAKKGTLESSATFASRLAIATMAELTLRKWNWCP